MGIGADVGSESESRPQHPAAWRGGQGHLVALPSSVGTREEQLPPLLDPCHRPLQEKGCSGHHCVLRVEALHPEGAADLGHREADLRGLQPEHPGELIADLVRRLNTHMHVDALTVRHRQHRQRLHRRRCQARMVDDDGHVD